MLSPVHFGKPHSICPKCHQTRELWYINITFFQLISCFKQSAVGTDIQYKNIGSEVPVILRLSMHMYACTGYIGPEPFIFHYFNFGTLNLQDDFQFQNHCSCPDYLSSHTLDYTIACFSVLDECYRFSTAVKRDPIQCFHSEKALNPPHLLNLRECAFRSWSFVRSETWFSHDSDSSPDGMTMGWACARLNVERRSTKSEKEAEHRKQLPSLSHSSMQALDIVSCCMPLTSPICDFTLISFISLKWLATG